MSDRSREAWHPQASLGHLRRRAQILAYIREYFAARHVLEVETPLLSAAASTDVNLDTIRAGDGYLHTSPEFAMKRLLAADMGDIYQICKVFRQGERGRYHNPEFTLLEWYRVGWEYRRLMQEVAELLGGVLGITTAPEYVRYRDAFWTTLALDPLVAPKRELECAAARAGLNNGVNISRDELLDALAGICVYPSLGKNGLTFIYDFPSSQAALARIRPDVEPVAERFEVVVNGLELGNGYTELTDAQEQQARFAADLAARKLQNKPKLPIDKRFLSALGTGLPESAGVALGVDRMVMLACNASQLAEVMTFTQENA